MRRRMKNMRGVGGKFQLSCGIGIFYRHLLILVKVIAIDIVTIRVGQIQGTCQELTGGYKLLMQRGWYWSLVIMHFLGINRYLSYMVLLPYKTTVLCLLCFCSAFIISATNDINKGPLVASKQDSQTWGIENNREMRKRGWIFSNNQCPYRIYSGSSVFNNNPPEGERWGRKFNSDIMKVTGKSHNIHSYRLQSNAILAMTFILFFTAPAIERVTRRTRCRSA